jgi:hypothetical protein
VPLCAFALRCCRIGIRQSASPFAGSRMVPMLVIGLVLTFAGMIAALALS